MLVKACQFKGVWSVSVFYVDFIHLWMWILLKICLRRKKTCFAMKLEQPQLTMLLSVGSRRSWNGDRVLSEKQQESEFEVKIEDFCAAGKSIFEAGITLVRRGLALPAPIL